MLDLNRVTEKWKKRWEDTKIYEADAKPGQKKFFLTFPYPYMNGYLHVGHFYSALRVDVMARYKRMQGFNVLFPQGWHCTGSPIENAAQRIREKEEKQWSMMRSMGFSDEEIKKFEDPKHWVEFFPIQAKKDLQDMGFSIDWRRSFITTNLNPHYDAFIKWQFNKLREGNHVIKGKFPVVWCIKDNSPVGDHSRVEGEGETPQEYILMKYQYGNELIVTATLRPETLFGDTNLWIHPDAKFVKAKVDDEEWIISKSAAEKLKEQDKHVKITSELRGSELVGKFCTAPLTNAKIPILPATFADPDLGTGIVRSVPAHAPPDWMALKDLQSKKEIAKKYHLSESVLSSIRPISVIKLEGFGEFPAAEICDRMGIKDQNDPNLDEATKEIYKKEFFSGIMKESSGVYSGLSTEQTKKQITNDLGQMGDKMYELTGKVICRCLTPSIVKIVTDQWFLNYSEEAWKRKARGCLAQMKLYPEQVRGQFEYVLGWLQNWACTREYGLGTRLPWDDKWVIESLSDSTIYMAYYTVTHILQQEPKHLVNDALFDYVFFGKGSAQTKTTEKMREEFEYWYPLDFRNSGKDLIQNHLAFSIFNHVAVFEKSKWPQGFSVNGFVTVDGEKMSKSKGNIILMSQMAKQFGADSSRFTILSGGEYLDDANWDSELAKSMHLRLQKLHEFISENYNKGVNDHRQIDAWMESKFAEVIRDATEAMEEAYFRTAIQKSYYDLQRHLKWYLRRTAGKPTREIINKSIKTLILLLSPFTPFFCEEAWESIGEKGNASTAQWPSFDKNSIKPELDELEEIVEKTLDDIKTILKLINVEKPKKIELFVAERWKYELYVDLEKFFKETRNYPDVLKKIMGKEKYKPHGKTIPALVQKIVKNGLPSKLPKYEYELSMLADSKEFLSHEFGCGIEVKGADASQDPKAKNSLPGKPAIKVS